jgi:hypothetical protein
MSDLQASLDRELRASDRPVSAAALKKRLRAGDVPFREAVEKALSDRVFWRWPNYGSSHNRLWHLDPDAVIREKILEVARETALSSPDLSKAAWRRVHGCSEKAVQAAVRRLVADGQLHAWPAIGRERNRLGAPGIHQAYKKALHAFVAAKLKAAGIHEDAPPLEQSPPAALADLQERILACLSMVEPVAGLPVSARKLRQHESLRDVPKADFDRAVLELRDARRVSLNRHDDAWNLPPDERDLLVTDVNGNHYVAVSLRTE